MDRWCRSGHGASQ